MKKLAILLFIMLLINIAYVSASGDNVAQKVEDFLNNRTGGGVEYVSYEALGFIYEIIVEYQGQEVPVYATIDGVYFVQGAVLIENIPDNAHYTGLEAGQIIVGFLNDRTGGGVEYIEYEDLGDIYEIVVEYQNQEVPVFITKDGMYFVQGAINMDKPLVPEPEPEPQVIPQSNVPEVELFVMTHCPYGMQAEKGIIPVFELLGDKIEGNIMFIHYFMHDPEVEETPLQACLKYEHEEIYLNYLKCFLEEGDSDRCLGVVDVNMDFLEDCLEKRADFYYEADSILSEVFGVRGSPTLVINDIIVSSGRSPQAYLDTICEGFINKPDECNEEMSSVTPAPGFGYSSGGSSGDAYCNGEGSFYDLEPETVLLEPADDYKIKTKTSTNINFKYRVNSEVQLNECILVINNEETIVETNIIMNAENSFLKLLRSGTYNWKVKCYDFYNHEAISETRTLKIEKTSSSSSGGSSGGSSEDIPLYVISTEQKKEASKKESEKIPAQQEQQVIVIGSEEGDEDTDGSSITGAAIALGEGEERNIVNNLIAAVIAIAVILLVVILIILWHLV